MSLATRIAQEFNNVYSHVSVPTSYHIYNGSVEATNTVLTNGFGTTLYTGNGGTQSITTSIDMNTQWGNDASEKFGGLVWIKSRSLSSGGNTLFDTIRGVAYQIQTNNTSVNSLTNRLSSFNANGFTVGTANDDTNTNLATYASWNFQTTHRVSGTTNHGKAYTCHYNPFTGFTIVKYEGSGIAGHEIPHHLGRKLGFATVKTTNNTSNWVAGGSVLGGGFLLHNSTQAFTSQSGSGAYFRPEQNTDSSIVIVDSGIANEANISGNSYILYGWANSYFDAQNTLIGNYEVGVYQGTGTAGNKVTTRGKPAWIMFKRLDSTSNWSIVDNKRNNISGVNDGVVWANSSNIEGTADLISFETYGFTLTNNSLETNASGGQYLYMVVYDNDSGSGKSKYPKATDTTNLNINALVPYANGIDTNGSKVSISYKNETITGLTLTKGKNYVYSKNDGTYGVSSTPPSYGKDNPLTGDFFNLKTLKWYNSSNVEITPRTYLDCIVHADHNGQVSYVAELPKTTYFDEVKANEFKGKNACTAWVNFDGTTTPPTIRDSYNVSSVVRTATGYYDVYFKEAMDNNAYSGFVSYTWQTNVLSSGSFDGGSIYKCQVRHAENNTLVNTSINTVHIYGGKN